MRTLLLVAAAALAGGCGTNTDRGPDYANNFAGIWTGDLTITNTATGDVFPGGTTEANFEIVAQNTLKFANACQNNTGPIVVATSATEFSGNMAYSCRPVMVQNYCAAVVFTWTSTSGSLTGPVLTFTSVAAVTGCAVNQNLSFAFTNGLGGGTPSH